MKTPIVAVMTLSLVLAGCGTIRESRINPFNWFGKSEDGPATLTPSASEATADARPLVQQVTQLEVAPAHGGVIVQAAGLPPTQGWWNAELVAENDGQPVDGVLSFRFVLIPPLAGTPAANRVSTPQSREVTVATFVPNGDLAQVARISVTGSGNARSVSR
ncbi:hypothetical protein CCR83_03540 [Rhodobacter veldkampii DSM 11550]|uniref:Lipoprotein n=1 Tax=Phaeovulum veldkampii DSM 11550 TaxID=1185920 RepID=A0A2T4JI21_9RHOB|nr:hypothetical protein [Phaeovulum veldkampii]MBK5945546.1 hypothetical protein [Phaeovulum veldkampii DSM 11550]PTE17559.1 hypothetical protein C5F46_08540 [Phaeovulum veldkampii DSM 11550]TDQ60275.1 hypothetical protein EV658_10552 [Phaeovulum veldkampii DSM 11550]